MPTIRTPDQRVRVFISSTINELADGWVAPGAEVSGLDEAAALAIRG